MSERKSKLCKVICGYYGSKLFENICCDDFCGTLHLCSRSSVLTEKFSRKYSNLKGSITSPYVTPLSILHSFITLEKSYTIGSGRYCLISLLHHISHSLLNVT